MVSSIGHGLEFCFALLIFYGCNWIGLPISYYSHDGVMILVSLKHITDIICVPELILVYLKGVCLC